jgi:branched-chain amino acid transport system permease protein
MLLGTLVYGFINSVMLALVALGFNLTFGISGVANFSYGALYVFAGYATWILMNNVGLSYVAAIPLSVLLTAIIGALLYRFILLRIRGLVVSEVIATFGIGLAILEIFRYLGFIGYEYTLPAFLDGGWMIGNTFVDFQRLFIVGIGIGLAFFLWVFTHHTRTGLAFRGIAQEERTALTLGIDSDWVATLSVAFGAGLAAVAAIGILPIRCFAQCPGRLYRWRTG